MGSRRRHRIGPGNPVWYHRSACNSHAVSAESEVKNCCARIAAQPSRRAHLSRFPRSSLFYFALVVVLGLVIWFTWQSFQGNQNTSDWSFSTLMNQAAAGNVKEVDIKGTDGVATGLDGRKHNVVLPDCASGAGCTFVDTLSADKTSDGTGVNVK